MIYQNAVLIYNPAARRLQRKPGTLQACTSELCSVGHRFKVISTTHAGSTECVVRRCLREHPDALFVLGGDGTVNEAVNGLANTATPLGVLPAGTGNGFAAETGIPEDPVLAARCLSGWLPRRVQLGRYTNEAEPRSRYFLLLCGAGFDATVIQRVPALAKRLLGKFAFWLTGLSFVLGPLPRFNVEVNGALYCASLAAISRIQNYGGTYRLARSVSLLDDAFELVLLPSPNPLAYIRYALAVARGKLHTLEEVSYIRTRSVRLTPQVGDRIPIHLDGECVGILPAAIELQTHSVVLLLPRPYGQHCA